MIHQAIVIFGSTGNLMYKKLLPALYQLLQQKQLPNTFRIIAIGRRDFTIDDYVNDAKNQVAESIDWSFLRPFIDYINMDLDNPSDYHKLLQYLQTHGIDDRMIYLAVPPRLFPVITEKISLANIVEKGNSLHRIVFEKPFGENLQTAKEINMILWNYLSESQIYRIDHYLGKEMIQNILVVRFGNRIFEHTWNKQTIRNIVIIAKETEGVMSRGNYYDSIGALKDMFQSHLLQMAALITMTKPDSFQSEDIKNRKIAIFKDLKIVDSSIVRGQYRGYTETEKINPKSQTETFVFMEARINQPKWEGVPIYFITGKKLNQKRSEIIVHFNDDDSLFSLYSSAKPRQNKLLIKVAPDEGVEFYMNVKQPGLDNKVTTASLDYCHSSLALSNSKEAYEKLLLDFATHHKTLFTRWDEIEATWQIVETIKEVCDAPIIYNDYRDLIHQIQQIKGVNIDDL